MPSKRVKKMQSIEATKSEMIEGMTADFVKRLARVLSKTASNINVLVAQLETSGERVVTNTLNLQRAVNARVQIEEMLLQAGYRDNVQELLRAYDKIAALTRDGFTIGGANVAFTRVDIRILTTLKEMDFSRWESFGQDIIENVHQQIVNSVVAGARQKDIVKSFEDTLLGMGEKESLYESRARTLANTFAQSFDRVVIGRKAAEAGIETFVYLGPDDKLTRPFCTAALAGNGAAEFKIPDKDGAPIYTLAEIDKMENGTPLPPFQYGGGWNCRHRWRPVSAEIATEIREEQEAVA